MKNRILVSVTPEETSMALVEEGLLQEYLLERNNEEHIVGSIFKGRVKNVLDGLQAAFIDVGRDRNVFFYNSENMPLAEGQTMLVQIIKDSMGSKGPRASDAISLPGRYVVFLPLSNYIGISKKITDQEERARLKELVEQVRTEDMGVIVRTVAEGVGSDELAREIKRLSGLWKALEARAARASAPSLLFREVDLPVRIVRDYLNERIDELVIDDREIYQRVSELVSYIYPDYKGKIVFFELGSSIFQHYGVAGDINSLASRTVGLECGGYLVFDHTEAFTVIDVNTGRFKGADNLENTAARTNLEAVAEIARQIRLRDIGGIIIIDFIDMNDLDNQQKVLAALEEALQGDRMKPRVLGITMLGLVEMTRKKARQNTMTVMFSTCPVCNGSGMVKSPEAVAVDVCRQMRAIKHSRPLLLQAHPSVAERFIKYDLERVSRIRKIRVQAVDGMHPESFTLLDDSGVDK